MISSAGQKSTSKKQILVVEDEKPLARALQVKLTKAGFACQTAVNGEEALAVIAKETFDLVLLDLLMPGMDGWDFLENLSKGATKTPVIVISNLNQSEDIQRAMDLGATDFMVKSDVSLAEIVEKAQELFGS